MVFLYSNWVKLPISTRNKIAELFDIKKNGSTEVFNNEVVKDGYPIGDIDHALTKDAINAYLGTKEEDFGVLWNNFIAKVEGREVSTVHAAPIIPESVVHSSPMAQAVPEKEKVVEQNKRGPKPKHRA